MPKGKDLLGKKTTKTEEDIRRLYHDMKKLAARKGLPPAAEYNVKKALACLWCAVVQLDLEYEQLYDLGV